MKIEYKSQVQKMVLIGILAAVIAVLSPLSIPLPGGVPLTLQTFAVALCGFILGARLGPISVAVYIVLGAVGLPIFAGFSGGVGMLASPSGGFLWGFLLLAAACGLGVYLPKRFLAVLTGCAGLLICHLVGVLQFMVVTSTPFLQSFLLASMPFLIKDLLSVAGAYLIGSAVLVGLKKAKLVTVG